MITLDEVFHRRKHGRAGPGHGAQGGAGLRRREAKAGADPGSQPRTGKDPGDQGDAQGAEASFKTELAMFPDSIRATRASPSSTP